MMPYFRKCIICLPGPSDQWGSSTSQGHDPGENDTHNGMVLTKSEIAHGLADHYISFNGQDYQAPQSHFTCVGDTHTHIHILLATEEKRVVLYMKASWITDSKQVSE